MATFYNETTGEKETAVHGVSQQYCGVWGESHGSASGVYGRGITSFGVNGESDSSVGTRGTSQTGRGVEGWSRTTEGVFGWSESGSGVSGISVHSTGVVGGSENADGVIGTGRRGVVGLSPTFQGVYGESGDNAGVVGVSARMHGVFAESHSATGVGVFAHNTAGGLAGEFRGPVVVTGDLTVTGDVLLAGADYAEELPAGRDVRPGDCVVIDRSGAVVPCTEPYDGRVAGVVSGAGGLRPAIVLDRQPGGAPIALMGKAFVRAAADGAPIEVGDLLTTSSVSGHAMVVQDRARAFGAVIGKALTSLPEGRGLVQVFLSAR